MNKKIKFASSLTQAWMNKDYFASSILLAVLVSLFVSFVIWTTYFELEILTRGTGAIVPSESVITVDNYEGDFYLN